jgi:hypothetical protein
MGKFFSNYQNHVEFIYVDKGLGTVVGVVPRLLVTIRTHVPMTFLFLGMTVSIPYPWDSA